MLERREKRCQTDLSGNRQFPDEPMSPCLIVKSPGVTTVTKKFQTQKTTHIPSIPPPPVDFSDLHTGCDLFYVEIVIFIFISLESE